MAGYFRTTIKCSEEVSMIFIFLRIFHESWLTVSEHKYFPSVEKLWFQSMPKLDNFIYCKSDTILEIA